MKEFFGIGGYARPAEGFLSWQHLLFVSILTMIMILSAVILGKKNRTAPLSSKNRVLIVSAILIDAIEIAKIIFMCFRSGNPTTWLYELPLFLCSIQLITLPLAAFSHGRTKEAALDFVCIFGVLGAISGTYLAGNNYGSYPVLCFDNVVSGITHMISGFASLYIFLVGMASMKKKNILFTFSILIGFCAAAYLANIIVDYNYMFLMGGDGTPYDILFDLVNGHNVIYPLSVVALFLLYISGFYAVYFFLTGKRSHARRELAAPAETQNIA